MDILRELYRRIFIGDPPEDRVFSEREMDYSSRWVSLHIIFFTTFLMSLSFSIVLTGIWPYLSELDPSISKEFMGIVVAVNPLGQLIFSPFLGTWCNRRKSVRLPIVAMLALFIVANILYSSLELFWAYLKFWMITSRFLVGVASCSITACRTYVSTASRLSERVKANAMLSLAQVLGFIFGPLLQAAVTPLGRKGVELLGGLITINMYTACSWINVLLSIGNLFLFHKNFFKEDNIVNCEALNRSMSHAPNPLSFGRRLNYLTVYTLIAAFFVLTFNFVLLETLGTPLTMDQFAWSKTESLYKMGFLMAVGAGVALVTTVSIPILCKFFQEHLVLLWGSFGLMVVGRLLYIPWGSAPPKLAEVYNVTVPIKGNLTITPDDPMFLGCPKTQEWCATTNALTEAQFYIGFLLTGVGYPIGITLIATIFSKVLNRRPQGTWMGWMTSAGCLSRCLGPLFVCSVYTRLGLYWTFGGTAVMMFLFLAYLFVIRGNFIAPGDGIRERDNNIELAQLRPNVEQAVVNVEPAEENANNAQEEIAEPLCVDVHVEQVAPGVAEKANNAEEKSAKLVIPIIVETADTTENIDSQNKSTSRYDDKSMPKSTSTLSIELNEAVERVRTPEIHDIDDEEICKITGSTKALDQCPNVSAYGSQELNTGTSTRATTGTNTTSDEIVTFSEFSPSISSEKNTTFTESGETAPKLVSEDSTTYSDSSVTPLIVRPQIHRRPADVEQTEKDIPDITITSPSI